MKRLYFIFTLTLAAFLPEVGYANACHSAASSLASQEGGKVLRVKEENGSNGVVCVVTMQVQPDPNKPPRVVTKRIRP